MQHAEKGDTDLPATFKESTTSQYSRDRFFPLLSRGALVTTWGGDELHLAIRPWPASWLRCFRPQTKPHAGCLTPGAGEVAAKREYNGIMSAMSRCVHVFFLAAISCSTVFGAALLYNNTTDTHASTGLVASQALIVFDDVLVPSARDPLGLPLAITNATVEVSGAIGDTTSFSLWTAPLQSTGIPFGAPILVATQPFTFTSSFQQLTFGNGSAVLFTVNPNATAQPGSLLFYVGLSAAPGPAVDWSWADGPDANLPTAYTYNFTVNTYFLNTSSPPFPAHVSYSLSLEGNVVPEPSTFCLVLLGVVAACSRARFCFRSIGVRVRRTPAA